MNFEETKYSYPYGYMKLKELNLVDFDNWYFIPNDQLENRFVGIRKRYPSRRYIPFARRDDCDDIACFEEGKGDIVFIVHDYASEGTEERSQYVDVWEWFKDAVFELINNNR
ncbi:MAG: hypothetical protein IKE94_12475 [Aeriscardovia sp.]|nr:hypothetical protein [Aeriscardovia sp.]